MRLFKLQIIVASVAFLFGALKGFNFVGGYYQASFLLTLYATSVSFVIAFLVSKAGAYEVIKDSDTLFNFLLSGIAILGWITMFVLHLHFSESCMNGSTPCDELKIRDFLISGIFWVIAPLIYTIWHFISRKQETVSR